MIKLVSKISGSIFIIVLFFSCSPINKNSEWHPNNKASVRRLNDSAFNLLRMFLAVKTRVLLKDTVMLKYDYNNNSCWSALDLNDYINRVMKQKQDWIIKVEKNRSGISVFTFREPRYHQIKTVG